MAAKVPTTIEPAERLLTEARFQQLADVPPEIEWFANLGSEATRRAYETAIGDFMQFTGIRRPEEFHGVTRAHVIAWRDDLVRRELGGSTVRHRLSSLSSLFEYLCERNAVTHNRSRACAGRASKAEKARRRRSAITKRGSYWRRQTPIR